MFLHNSLISPTHLWPLKGDRGKLTYSEGKSFTSLKKLHFFVRSSKKIKAAVVVQLVEHQIVVLVVAGSSPVDRPIFQTQLFHVSHKDISGNFGLFQVPVFPNKSGNPYFNCFISDYFYVFQNYYTFLYMKLYMGFWGWPGASLVNKS